MHPCLQTSLLKVLLHKGKFENDFENYGVDILVKYRDKEPLQKLTAHHQVLRQDFEKSSKFTRFCKKKESQESPSTVGRWKKRGDSPLHARAARVDHRPLPVCGRDQPGDGRLQREKSLWASRPNFLSREQRSIFPAHAKAVAWAGILTEDECPHCEQRPGDVSSFSMENGRIQGASPSMKKWWYAFPLIKYKS